MESLISILIPCRNEEKFIQSCLASICAMVVPDGVEIEILVLDGRSIDRSRMIVADAAAHDSRIRLVDNPGLTAPCALNAGIQHSRGSWIMRLDAHTNYPRDYLHQCYATALRTGAANTGGICVTEAGGIGYSARLVQALTTHRFGVGDSGFRTGAPEGPRDTVPFGFFPRRLFERIGMFDERLARNQDYEFNRRIRNSGQTVWLNPAIRSYYFNQRTLGGFLRKQFTQEGPYNAYLWYLAPYAFAWRHAITACFVGGVVAGLVLSCFGGWIARGFAVVMAVYAVLALLSATQQAIRYRETRHVAVLPFGFLAFHFVHGLGVWRGLWTLAGGRAPVQTRTPPWTGASYQRWSRAGMQPDPRLPQRPGE